MSKNIKSGLKDELEQMKQAGLYKRELTISGKQGAVIKVGERELLNFCSNNYLGLAGSQTLIPVAQQALEDYGFGMASVRFICGTGEIHKELESEVAKFFGFEDAILYTSCFDANTGLFETLLTADDAVLSDELNHASIIDGIRLCKAERLRFKHSDMDDLEEKLKQASSKRRRLIVTDGVFSMDGEVAHLDKICDLAERYDALVMVDDSHGSGVLGVTGRGSIEEKGAMGRIDILTSTFGKALGGATGGFTAASKEIVEYLRQRSRPYLFSNTLPAVVAAVAYHVLKNFEKDFLPLRKKLIENMSYFRDQISSKGFVLGGDGNHPITPIMLPDEKQTMAMADAAFEQGIYVRGFVYPVVPQGKPRIRVQISAAHEKEHLDKAIAVFEQLNKK